jgi:hypothetical protein
MNLASLVAHSRLLKQRIDRQNDLIRDVQLYRIARRCHVASFFVRAGLL